jgi:hypothetical protein
MLRTALVLLFVAATTPAAAFELPPLCQALHGMGDAARAAGGAQRVTVAASGCQPVGDAAAGRAFCAAAAAVIGADGLHMLPWSAEKCVDNLLAEPQLTTAAGDVGPKHRKQLTHLAAGLGHGVRLDVSLAGDRYDVVVWAPK